MLEHTKRCVPSVLRHNRAPFERIFLDIGLLDGTAEYLAGPRTQKITPDGNNINFTYRSYAATKKEEGTGIPLAMAA